MVKVKEGDKSKAVCNDCAAMVSTTFKVRGVPFSDGSGTVENILAGICDQCDRVVSIPNQSAQNIKKAFDKLHPETEKQGYLKK